MRGKIVFRSLLGAYLFTTVLLLMLAFLLFRFDLGERLVGAGITVTYIVSCFLGGFLAGRKVGKQKYLWGLLLGLLYFLLLLGVSCIMAKGAPGQFPRVASALCLCLGGGMLGGMVS